MPEIFAPYQTAILCLGLMSGLLIVQILVADVVAIARKHTPGMPIDDGHDNFLFRSARTAANSNETLAAFIGSLLFCILIGADATWVNGLTALYLAGRLGHMICYYLNWKLARSAIFALTVISILGLVGTGLRALL